MNRKFVIFAPPWNENSGGVICLHKLCHLLNEIGAEAYLCPSFENIEINKRDFVIPILKFGREIIRVFSKYVVNDAFNTPLLDYSKYEMNKDEYIVVYYEQVLGNPLGAKYVVRWLLHTPGYHTGNIYYGQNEIYYKHGEGIRDFYISGSYLSKHILKIIHYPLEYYNENNVAAQRVGTAYCRRKGSAKEIVHDLDDSILIDGMSHEEIAKIFKRCTTFISYDSYTAYSQFAALCGCESIVIPDYGVDIDTWFPEIQDRYGISYGFDQLDWAKRTKPMLLGKINSDNSRQESAVKTFINEVNAYFRQQKTLFRRHLRDKN